MNKLLMTSLSIIIFLASGCSAIINTAEPTESNGSEEPTEVDQETPMPSSESEYVKSSLSQIIPEDFDPGMIKTLALDNTAFALAFYDQIRHEDGNIIYSPLSISLALSMTLAGAETTTLQAMKDALQFSLPVDNLHPTFNALISYIEESENQNMEGIDGSQFQLNIANSIWGQSGYDFKQAFLDTLAKYYGSGIYNVDFINNPEKSRIAINDWVEEETQDKIKDLIPEGAIDNLTRLVLANAIYFNGSWMYPFAESLTAEAPFTTLDGSETYVEMMKISGERFQYSDGEGYEAIILPYLSRDFNMLVLVPELGTYKDFEGSLSTDLLSEILENMPSEAVNLEMPKFDFETTTNATDPLMALGMAEAFQGENADFSGITEVEKLYISDVLHKATIIVDEEGTEAAAATAVIMKAESAMPGEPKSLVIDRPFMFFIQHQPTGSILFMGRVTEP